MNDDISRGRRLASGGIFWHELWDEFVALMNLMAPTAIIQLGFTVCPFLTASYVGRNFGPVYLDGFTLSYLTGNLSTLSLLQGLFSASDTLSPQAFGAGNHVEVGLIAIRGLVGTLSIVVPINLILAVFLQSILTSLGEDAEASRHAQNWYRIYIAYLPFYCLYGVTWKFLSAQNLMRPLLAVCLISVCLILPFSLEVFTKHFGFLGSAMAVVTFQMAQALLLLLYLAIWKPHVPTTWPPGLLCHHWRDALEWKAFRRYMHLGVGGILMSCEWIYWETISLMIGTFGVVPLSVHTIPTQVMTVCFMVPLGCGIALAIRIGNTLPAYENGVKRAQVLAASVFCGSCLVFGMVAIAMYQQRYWIYALFLQPNLDADVWAGCDRIWVMVCAFYFNLSVFGINLGIATGLGMQWTLGLVSVLFMWVLGFPLAWHAASRKMEQMALVDPDHNGTEALVAAWKWINPAYICINLVLLLCFVRADWYGIREKICLREGVALLSPEHHELSLDEAEAYDKDEKGYGSSIQ